MRGQSPAPFTFMEPPCPAVVRSTPEGLLVSGEMFSIVLSLVPTSSAEHAVELITARNQLLAKYAFQRETFGQETIPLANILR